jgi:ribosomal protein L15E
MLSTPAEDRDLADYLFLPKKEARRSPSRGLVQAGGRSQELARKVALQTTSPRPFSHPGLNDADLRAQKVRSLAYPRKEGPLRCPHPTRRSAARSDS